MNKREATFQSLFGRWLKAKRWTAGSANFELKRTLNHSIGLAQIKAHQTGSLVAGQTGLYYKIPDDSRSSKPFDCSWWDGTPGYVVVAYGARLTGFYIIPAEAIQRLQERRVVSLTEVLAKELGTYYPVREARETE